mmetsp:Transcript_28820/g.89693  ORF Transcript_28820/g.89693 Transcript_28820/m.89693 type:complete len:675 (-) Transcript_28820:172-2196(-)
MAAANQLARQLLESEDPSCHHRVRADAQKDNAVDSMANLFHMAPEAAADMLQILMVKPRVEDSGRHPIRSRASLWGLFYSRSMRCEYQSDADIKDNLKWPVWKFDSTRSDDRFLEDQKDILWHLRLVKTPDDSEERREYVDDVDTKVVLLPNILDIDIFMALASAGENHSRIFSKLPVQGIICCLWDHLITPAVITRLLFNGLDLAVQSVWGLTNVGPNGDSKDTNSPLFAPVWWSILLAGLLRDVTNLVWWFCAFYEKWRGHYGNFQTWQKTMIERDAVTPRPDRSQEPAGSPPKQRPPGLHALWRPQAFFTTGIIAYDLPMHCAKAWFLWDVWWGGDSSPSMEMTDVQQALLTANALLTFFKLIYMLRLTNGCKRVTTILSAFVSGAIREMFLVTSLFFSAVVLAFAILKRKNTSSWIGLHLYRGLLFGDGGALDFMGLDPEKQEDGSTVRTMMMLATTILFNIVILNLTVAVYSSEYDRLERDSEVYLQRERAKTCCELLLSLQKIKLKDSSDAWRLQAAKVAGVAAVSASAALLCFQQLGFVRLRSFVAACLFAFAQVAFQAINMASHWFPRRDYGLEGPDKDHFLWMCHRSNYGEDSCNADLDKEALHDVLDERVGRLDERLTGRISRLDERVETLSAELDNKINGLNSQLSEVIRLLQSPADGTAWIT